MKKLFIFSLFILEVSILAAGNPAMLIRCRAGLADAETILVMPTCPDGQVLYQGQCFTTPEEGGCVSLMIGTSTYLALTPQDVMIDTSMVTICVPDCSSVFNCVECSGDFAWNAALQACVCLSEPTATSAEGTFGTFCGCPSPLEEAVSGIIDNTGLCVLPEADCYNLGINFTLAPLECNLPPSATTQTVSIEITPASPIAGGTPFRPGLDAVTLEDLENCVLLDGTGALLDVLGTFGTDDRVAFVADMNGKIIIDFTRNPFQPSTINFREIANMDITIPACEATAASIVPTMGEWALISLGLILMICSLVGIRQMQLVI